MLESLVTKLDSYISFGANDNMIQVKIDVNDQLLADIMANGNIKLPSEIGDITLPKVTAESAIYINAYLDKMVALANSQLMSVNYHFHSIII